MHEPPSPTQVQKETQREESRRQQALEERREESLGMMRSKRDRARQQGLGRQVGPTRAAF